MLFLGGWTRSSQVKQKVNTVKLSIGSLDQSATESLRRMKKIPAKNTGDLKSAVMSAAYYARKLGHTMFVYSGNSFSRQVYRVSDKPGEYLNPINNTGTKIVSVSPDFEVVWHEIV